MTLDPGLDAGLPGAGRDAALAPPFDLLRMERAVLELIHAVGEDPDRDGLLSTPGRVARYYAEVFAGLREDPMEHLETAFDVGHHELVLVRDIWFSSLCEHHFVPFLGHAHVAYLPGDDGRITGLSKLARVVDGYARRPQVQERLTGQVSDALDTVLRPRGVVVVLEAEHLCMTMRGVRKPGASTVTIAVRGCYEEDPHMRAEVLDLIGVGRERRR